MTTDVTGRTIDSRIVKSRGLSADFNSVHVITMIRGLSYRVASYKGSDYNRALVCMARYHQETGRHAFLARGTRYAFLPFPDEADWQVAR